MSIRPWRDIARRPSRQIMVGNVPVGGDAPVTVQTMTNTITADARATIDQIRRCEEAGADIIRVSCPDVESTAALKQIVRAARVPIVADIHFHYKRALEAADAGAACLRINPGNIGSAGPSARGGERRQGERLRDPHRRQCRKPRKGPARKIWRAMPRGAGRKRARSHPAARGS
jgi:4-hydroxy-3-methylbut-2-en-1-yl diphosphate synthase IspG/GcpE